MVLVADDEKSVREIIVAHLKHAGYRILVTCDSRDTVAVFSEHAEEIGAALLDYHMPGGSGTEVLEELQRIRPNIPVIMMSGFAEEALVERAKGRGLVEFLRKPFGRLSLLDAVRKALNPPAAQSSTGSQSQ
jgi:FixJ family two-component response regulator